MKDAKNIESMIQMMMNRGKKPKGEDEDENEVESEDGESEGGETEVKIEICGKDALKQAYLMLTGGLSKKNMRK